jgi:DNA primase
VQLPSPEQRIFYEQAVTRYQADLAGDARTQAYLLSRGFSQEVAATARLGVVAHPLRGHEQLRGRLCIPYLTAAGPVNFSFRCLKDHDCKTVRCPKYLPMQSGIEKNMYNVQDTFKTAPAICVTEGELDALTLSTAGFPAVGLPGVKSWKKHYSRVLEDFPVIYVVGDGDTAGSGLNDFLSREVQARQILLPKGMDVNDIWIKQGQEGISRLFA